MSPVVVEESREPRDIDEPFVRRIPLRASGTEINGGVIHGNGAGTLDGDGLSFASGAGRRIGEDGGFPTNLDTRETGRCISKRSQI